MRDRRSGCRTWRQNVGMTTAHEQAVIDLVQAFSRGDSAAVRAMLADDLVAFVTEPDGSTREVRTAASYAAIVDAMDPVSANLRMDVLRSPPSNRVS